MTLTTGSRTRRRLLLASDRTDRSSDLWAILQCAADVDTTLISGIPDRPDGRFSGVVVDVNLRSPESVLQVRSKLCAEAYRSMPRLFVLADALHHESMQAWALGATDTISRPLCPISNPKGWEVAALRSLASKIGSGATPKGGDAAYKKAGIKLVRSMNVRDEGFLSKGIAFIDDVQAAKLSGVTLEAGDVLLNITGASVARVCVCPEDALPGRVNQHVSIIRLKDSCLNQYVALSLKMPAMKVKLLGIAEAGATRQAITKAQIEELKIPMPSGAVIQRFNSTLHQLSPISKAMAVVATAEEHLFSSLQHRAFSGQL